MLILPSPPLLLPLAVIESANKNSAGNRTGIATSQCNLATGTIATITIGSNIATYANGLCLCKTNIATIAVRLPLPPLD